MGLFTRGLGKPGKGIDANAPEKRSFFRFFDIFFRKFWHFVRLNILYVVMCIPTFIIIFVLSSLISNSFFDASGVIDTLNSVGESMAAASESGTTAEMYTSRLVVFFDVLIRFGFSFLFMAFWGMGPVSAGLAYVLRNWAREEHAWVWADFKDAAKSNFKQAAVVFIVDVIVYIVYFSAYIFYSRAGGALAYVNYLLLIILLIYTMMHMYIYQLMVTFKLSLKDLYKNALIFAIGKAPSNLLYLFLMAVVNIGPIYLAILLSGSFSLIVFVVVLLLELLILQTLSAFIAAFGVNKKIQKYMLTQYDVTVKRDK